MRIIRHPIVTEELINLAYHIALDSMEVANRFLDACEETFLQLANLPLVGTQRTFSHPDLREVRMWHIKGQTFSVLPTSGGRGGDSSCRTWGERLKNLFRG